MNFDEMTDAVKEAEHTMSIANIAANKIAHMLVGRLRKVDSWVLADLKRELRAFDLRGNKWKDER